MNANIVLVGMPASGKTTIGKLLAEKLPEYSLIDTDSVIEKTQGMMICEIFQKYSEDYFRQLEHDTIKMSDLDILYSRISEDSTRPLLAQENPRKILEKLLEKREENYQKAHYIVDTSSLNENEIIRFILNETNS